MSGICWLVALLLLAGCAGPQLPPKGTVSGVVTDADGRLLSGCGIVREYEKPSDYPMTEEAAVSGTDGAYRWQMYPGTYKITATCTGHDQPGVVGGVVVVSNEQVAGDISLP